MASCSSSIQRIWSRGSPHGPLLVAVCRCLSVCCSDWGRKAFTGYLGEDKSAWKSYDATELAATYSGPAASLLIDQGSADEFLTKGQLLPENLQAAVAGRGDKTLSVDYRLQDGYDHSYFFIHSFINDHIAFHAKHLNTQ